MPSNRQIAKTIGVGHSTVDRDVAPDGAPATKKTTKDNGSETAAAPVGPPALSGADAAKTTSWFRWETIAAGVPARTTMPYQFTTSKFGSVSFAAGTSGKADIRFGPVVASARSRAGIDMRLRDRERIEHELHLTADRIGEGW